MLDTENSVRRDLISSELSVAWRRDIGPTFRKRPGAVSCFPDKKVIKGSVFDAGAPVFLHVDIVSFYKSVYKNARSRTPEDGAG